MVYSRVTGHAQSARSGWWGRVGKAATTAELMSFVLRVRLRVGSVSFTQPEGPEGCFGVNRRWWLPPRMVVASATYGAW